MVFKSDKHTMAGYSNGSQSPERLNRIVEGTHIEGDIKSDSNIRIDAVSYTHLTLPTMS